jgi:hypothetical protein
MENYETARFDIQNVTYTADGSLVDRIETIVTIYQTLEMKFDRDQMISKMRQQGSGFYFKDKNLHIDWLGLTPYIHYEKGSEPRDILE